MYTFGCSRIQLTLNNTGSGLTCAGLLTHRFLSVNTENVFALYYDFLIKIYFLFMVKMQYIIHITSRIYANCFYVMLTTNSRLLVKFWGSHAIHRFLTVRVVSNPTCELFKVLLYLN